MPTRWIGLPTAVSRAGIVVIALLAVSCGGGTDVRTAVDDLATEPAAETSEQPATDAPTAAPTSGPTSGVEPAPEALAALDFQARTVGGGTIDGTTLAGTRTVLWIWDSPVVSVGHRPGSSGR